MNDDQDFSYLPIEVAGQVYGVPMIDVAAIRQMRGGETAEQLVIEGAVFDGAGAALTPIDLGHLFWDSANTAPDGYVVVVATPGGACALLVEDVRAARTAPLAAQHPLPRLIAPVSWLFMGIVSEGDALVLMLNAEGLIAQLREAAPELIVEVAYAA